MKKLVIINLILLVSGSILLSFKETALSVPERVVYKKDSVVSVRAFQQVYTVLMSARCMNCHPSGDVPLQGDDNHLHTMLPKRGIDGKGVYAMKCANCHQPTN
ncbi:MAG TPA: hypothetical protein VF500_17280, partial [Mucilaginibacter sp.]